MIALTDNITKQQSVPVLIDCSRVQKERSAIRFAGKCISCGYKIRSTTQIILFDNTMNKETQKCISANNAMLYVRHERTKK